MGPGVYFIRSAALPGVYLSPCVYMSLALIRINTVRPFRDEILSAIFILFTTWLYN